MDASREWDRSRLLEYVLFLQDVKVGDESDLRVITEAASRFLSSLMKRQGRESREAGEEASVSLVDGELVTLGRFLAERGERRHEEKAIAALALALRNGCDTHFDADAASILLQEKGTYGLVEDDLCERLGGLVANGRVPRSVVFRRMDVRLRRRVIMGCLRGWMKRAGASDGDKRADQSLRNGAVWAIHESAFSAREDGSFVSVLEVLRNCPDDIVAFQAKAALCGLEPRRWKGWLERLWRSDHGRNRNLPWLAGMLRLAQSSLAAEAERECGSVLRKKEDVFDRFLFARRLHDLEVMSDEGYRREIVKVLAELRSPKEAPRLSSDKLLQVMRGLGHSRAEDLSGLGAEFEAAARSLMGDKIPARRTDAGSLLSRELGVPAIDPMWNGDPLQVGLLLSCIALDS